ncbi:MAG: leucine-rich repeat protein [Christensenellales bacterium]
MARLDIHKKAFISWTGKDSDLKDKVVEFLKKSQIDVTVSDKECIDNFIEWSKESAMACSVMILLATENVIDSGVVYMEVGELIKSGSAKRLVVLSKNLETWNQVRESIILKLEKDSNYNSNIDDIKNALEYKSIIQYNNIDNFDDVLPDLYYKIIRYMIKEGLDAYKDKVLSEEMTVIPYIKTIGFTNINFISIPRTLIEEDSNQNEVKEYSSDDDFWSLVQSNKPMFIHGAGGEGKSEFIRQFKQSLVRKSIEKSNTEKDILPINIDCISVANKADDAIKRKIYSKFVGSIGLEEWKYEEFCNIFSNKYNVVNYSNRVKIVLFLDGLDEVPADRLYYLKNNIDEFLNNVDNVTLFLVGRNKDTAAKKLGLDTVNMHLKRLDDESNGANAMYSICESIFVGFEDSDGGEKNKFYLSLTELNQEIKSNPFLVTQLALIYRVDRSVPDTIFGIFEKLDQLINKKEIQNLKNDEYLKKIIQNPSKLMRNYAYQLFLSPDKDSTKNMSIALINLKLTNDWDREELTDNANRILDYFEERKIITIDGKLYHKMFLEYYTAVYLYNEIFDLSDQLKAESMFEGGLLWKLVNDWQDKYWYNTIKMFIVKADSLIDAEQMQELCQFIVNQGFEFKQEELKGQGIACFDYTLLCEVAAMLKHNRDIVNIFVTTDLLSRSANRQLPPYGPLCWYASRWELYSYLVRALYTNLSTDERALSLTADVCRIFGQAYTVQAVMGEEGKAIADTLWNNCQDKLEGVRKALCGAFCGVQVDCPQGDNIYPRFFNTKEVARLADYGVGVKDRMTEPFQDQLGLYNLDDLNVINNDECIGLVSWLNNGRQEIEDRLNRYFTHRICGVCVNNGSDDNFSYVEFDRTNVSVLYVPENVKEPDEYYDNFMPLTINKFKGVYVGQNVRVTKEQAENAFFKENKTIKSVSFDNDVTSIGNGTLYGCSNLTKIVVEEENVKYHSNGNCLIETISKTLIIGCQASVIPVDGSVTSIGKYAFYGCNNLTSIIIPDSVKSIESSAFYGCKSLTSVIFARNSQLASIGYASFFDCKNLTSITIPDSVKSVESSAFWGCESLTSVTFDGNSLLIGIGDGAFSGCSNLASITIPNNVTSIGGAAFWGCSSLTSITIPDSVTSIGDTAFWGCINLTKVTIPTRFKLSKDNIFTFTNDIIFNYYGKCKNKNDNNIYTNLKKNSNDSLDKYIIPNGVSSIKDWEFSRCSNLKTITIPNSVKSIGDRAFQYCSSLKSITIPNSVKSIGCDAFYECISLMSIVVEEGNTMFHSNGNCLIETASKTLIVGCQSSVIPTDGSVMSIGEESFFRCYGLKNITISNSVTSIGSSAFRECKNLTSITISDSVKSVGSSAFWGCESLMSVMFDENSQLATIEDNAFCYCNSLISIAIPDSVISIENSVFSDCSNLKNISLGKNVEKIGYMAFADCSSLQEITIPKSVMEIGEDAFSGCTGLKKIKIPKNFERQVKEIFRDAPDAEIEFY